MTLPISPPITLAQIATELGLSLPISLNDVAVRRLARAPFAGYGSCNMLQLLGRTAGFWQGSITVGASVDANPFYGYNSTEPSGVVATTLNLPYLPVLPTRLATQTVGGVTTDYILISDGRAAGGKWIIEVLDATTGAVLRTNTLNFVSNVVFYQVYSAVSVTTGGLFPPASVGTSFLLNLVKA